jgi:hypothetical protein
VDAMRGIEYLSFEAGTKCNLSHLHEWCPAHYLRREESSIPVEVVAKAIREALALGFTGHVAFHYYNEPLLYTDWIEEVMDAVPEARYLLWTNGELMAQHPDVVKRFGLVVRTAYNGEGNFPYMPDTRLENYEGPQRNVAKCRRQYVEVPIDHTGEMRLCCQDWLGTATFGNITADGFTACYKRWRKTADNIYAGIDPPGVCLTCTGVQL